MREFLYVLSTTAEPEAGTFAPIDVCEGVFVDRYRAADKARRLLQERTNNPAFTRDMHWQPFLDRPPEDECWKYMIPETGEVFAVIYHAFYERRRTEERRS